MPQEIKDKVINVVHKRPLKVKSAMALASYSYGPIGNSNHLKSKLTRAIEETEAFGNA